MSAIEEVTLEPLVEECSKGAKDWYSSTVEAIDVFGDSYSDVEFFIEPFWNTSLPLADEFADTKLNTNWV